MLNPEEGPGNLFRRALLPLAGVVFACAFFSFLPALLGQTIVDSPRFNDIGHQWIPFASFLKDCYSSGVFPLWDPHDMCGMPFLAFSHTSSLYPPWVVLNLVFEAYHRTMAFDIFIHLGLAGASTVLLLLFLGRSRTSAFIAGMVFAFSGFLFHSINVPHTLHTCAWIPAWYLACFSLLRRPRFSVYLAASLCLALMVAGGDLETTVYAFIGLIFELILRFREGTISRTSLVALAGSLVTAGIIASPMALPALELLESSIRAEGYVKPGNSALLLLLMIPLVLFHAPTQFFPANHGMDVFYLAPLLILFAVAGLKLPYARKRIMIVPVAFVYLLLFHTYPLNHITSWVPVLGKLMIPLRMWTVVIIFFLMASTYALDKWAQGLKDRHRKGNQDLLPFGRKVAVALIIYAAICLVSLYWFPRGWPLRVAFALTLAVPGIAALTPRFRLRRVFRRPLLTAAVIIVLDVYGLALGYMPMTAAEELKPDQRVASVVENTAGRTRYLVAASRGPHDVLLPFHLGLRLNADTIDTTVRIPLLNAARRLDMLYPKLVQYQDGLLNYDPWSLRDPANLDLANRDLLDRMNVGILLSRFPLPRLRSRLDLKPVRHDSDLYVYKNSHARERTVMKTGNRRVPLNAAYPAPGRVRIQLPEEVLQNSASPEILISDTYTPGWKARLGEKEIPITTGKTAFRKVQLPGPELQTGRAVIMSYEPVAFRLGLWAAVASLIAMGAAYISRAFRKGV
ncbi:MAG: hypothetical protein R6V10_15855 [bacterium]